jgi:hypothetical protein
VTATTYIAVSGSIRTGFTHYGPFGSVDQAQAWLSHEYRTEETRGATIVPLFGGIGITDEPEPRTWASVLATRPWTGVARP